MPNIAGLEFLAVAFAFYIIVVVSGEGINEAEINKGPTKAAFLS